MTLKGLNRNLITFFVVRYYYLSSIRLLFNWTDIHIGNCIRIVNSIRTYENLRFWAKSVLMNDIEIKRDYVGASCALANMSCKSKVISAGMPADIVSELSNLKIMGKIK